MSPRDTASAWHSPSIGPCVRGLSGSSGCPQQYFVALLGRVAAAAAQDGPSRWSTSAAATPRSGRPRTSSRRCASARPTRGARLRAVPRAARAARGDRRALPRRLRRRARPRARGRGRARARRPAIVELALVLAERGDTILLPDPGYPDYPSGVALAGARARAAAARPGRRLGARLRRGAAGGRRLPELPVEPVRGRARRRASSPPRSRTRERTGAAVVHDAAYIDLVFDGRAPESFLATPGAKEVGVEMWSMSKTYGMAGWRIGFVVGNAEIVERINLLERPRARRASSRRSRRRRSPR